MSGPVVIVGAGQAAAQAIASLRGEGFAGEILLFGDEPFLPYQRPPLSKAFLAGEAGPERLELRPEAFYRDHGVTLRLGERVTRIDLAARRVETARGGAAYGRLLIATGTRPRPLALPGHDLPGVHHIRAIRDVERFRAEMHPGARLVVIGGGYIGLEVAAKARRGGLDVTVLEAAPRVLNRVVAPIVSTWLAALHRGHGVTIHEGCAISAILGTDRAEAVALADGRRVAADVVLIAVGAVPNTELAAEAGLRVENGIVVDPATRASAPDVFAAGDVASFPSLLYGRTIRLESVQNAVDQARAAGAALAGRPVSYDPVPWFWSDQYEAKLQIAGLSAGHDRVEVEGQPEAGRFSVRYLAGSRLLAVDSINDARAHMLARRALAERETPAVTIADPAAEAQPLARRLLPS